MTHAQTMAQAHGIISREDLRRRELRPFSSDDSDDIRALALANRDGAGSGRGGSPDRPSRRMTFNADGTVVVEGEDERGSFEAPNFGFRVSLALGRKRGKDEADADATAGDQAEDDDEERTEVDEDEPAPSASDLEGSTLVNTAPTDFPPVFASPAISHPELFDSPAGSPSASALSFGGDKGLMLPPPVPSAGGRTLAPRTHRPFANRPGRMLGKTMSAPVHGLGYGSGFGSSGMDVDGGADGLPDGFDVAEWAKADPK